MQIQTTVAELAALIEGAVEGAGGRPLTGLRSPEAAGADDVAVIFRGSAHGCVAGCLVLGKDHPLKADSSRSLIRVARPEAALDALLSALAPAPSWGEVGVHPTAHVDHSAELGDDVIVGPHCVIGPDVRVGSGSWLAPGVVLGAGVQLGRDCRLHARVVVEHGCRLGDRVIIHPGAVIGADGFGYRQEGGRHIKSPQVGRVLVGDDVEIGANTTIDRARLEATVIGDGCKLDDQVHVAHNCQLGPNCALAAQVGLAGGVIVGRGVLMGGRSGASDGVTIGDGAVLGGTAVAFHDVPAGAFVLGSPAQDHRAYKREVLSLRRLPDLIARSRTQQTQQTQQTQDEPGGP